MNIKKIAHTFFTRFSNTQIYLYVWCENWKLRSLNINVFTFFFSIFCALFFLVIAMMIISQRDFHFAQIANICSLLCDICVVVYGGKHIHDTNKCLFCYFLLVLPTCENVFYKYYKIYKREKKIEENQKIIFDVGRMCSFWSYIWNEQIMMD